MIRPGGAGGARTCEGKQRATQGLWGGGSGLSPPPEPQAHREGRACALGHKAGHRAGTPDKGPGRHHREGSGEECQGRGVFWHQVPRAGCCDAGPGEGNADQGGRARVRAAWPVWRQRR